MKELVNYYAPRLSVEISLKWNSNVMRKRKDGHPYQGVNSPSIQIKEFGIVHTYHYIIISHDSLAISSHELALWWEELCLSEPHATLFICLNVMKKSLHPLVFPGGVRVTEDWTQHDDEIGFLFCLIMWREFWNNTTINNEHKVSAVVLFISHQQTQFLTMPQTNYLLFFEHCHWFDKPIQVPYYCTKKTWWDQVQEARDFSNHNRHSFGHKTSLIIPVL